VCVRCTRHQSCQKRTIVQLFRESCGLGRYWLTYLSEEQIEETVMINRGPTPPQTSDTLKLDDASWTFAVELYSKPGLSEACLNLQDSLEVDISFLLFVAFAASQLGIVLADADLTALNQEVSVWRGEVVRPLRAVRGYLKAHSGPALSGVAEPLRKQVKSAELLSEHVEFALLARWLDHNPRTATQGSPDIAGVLQRTVVVAARQSGHAGEALSAPQIKNALKTLADALR
jgi:uncharacterized protein (TIGR02444 family)